MNALFEQGGVVLGVIFGLSTAAWCLIGLQWRRIQIESKGGPWARSVLDSVRSGNREQAIDICRNRPVLAGRLMLAALTTREPQRRFFEKHLRPTLHAEASMLRGHLDVVAVIAAVLPLLGLLGTVLGMVETFGVLTEHGLPEAGIMAGGVSKALITTQAGLVTALPILLMHQALASRVRRCIDAAELCVKQVETLVCRD